ncbi:MAG: hypothetical protein PXZ07_05405 [Candidatus Eremiobacteraeota bacterium]|nr:hypothetical protein [Candidatus Eremiobacteraeota bacterium]
MSNFEGFLNDERGDMGLASTETYIRVKETSIMAESDRPREDSGGMSVREAGRRGGERVKAKYGPEFYEAIGRKGGQSTKKKYGAAFYESIGQKGGQTPKARREVSEAVTTGHETKPK